MDVITLMWNYWILQTTWIYSQQDSETDGHTSQTNLMKMRQTTITYLL